MRFVHTTSKNWYKVLYKHTVYVITLSNISINTNIKQITRVEMRLTNWYNTLKETTFCAWRHVCCRSLYCFVNVAHIYVFYPAFQRYDLFSKYFGRERLVQRSAILLSPQCGHTTSCIRLATLFKFKGKRTKC
jgi:hypothetical protein